jgi:hypothetical protein
MARRLSLADAFACAAAGVGSWLTRASLDVFPGAAGATRIAMFPAPAELVGLITLSFLCAFVLRTILARRQPIAPAASDGRFPPDVLLPFVSVLAIAIAFVPWVADVVPACEVLAGPARFALWALASAQALWIGGEAWRRRAILAREARAVRTWWPTVLVLLLTAACVLLIARHVPLSVLAADSSGIRLTPVASAIVLGVASALLWRQAERCTTSRGMAVAVWLGVTGTAAFLLASLVSPHLLLAVTCVTLTVAWPSSVLARMSVATSRTLAIGIRSVAMAVLASLGPGEALLAAILAMCLVWRLHASREPRPTLVAPLAIAAGAVAYALAALLSGDRNGAWWAPLARLVDQQDGVLFSAPIVLLAVPGWWQLWRDGGMSRITAIETAAGITSVLVTGAGWILSSQAIPGASLATALPLVVAPIGRWLQMEEPESSRYALARVLALAGVLNAVLLLVGRGGLVLTRNRDGIAALWEWLEPSRELVRVAPLAPAGGGADPAGFAAIALVWILALAAAAWLSTRLHWRSAGAAAAVTTSILVGSVVVASWGVGLTLGDRSPMRIEPSLRTEARLLDAFDERRRPIAVAYDPFRTVSTGAVPALFVFEATPGARRYPQPLRVLLNMRLSLPAGEYAVTLVPKPGTSLRGPVGLQVGRTGPPMREWQLNSVADQTWSASFTLPVDASFVALRTPPDFEPLVSAVRIQPANVVNDRDRKKLPPVLAAAVYRNVIVTFHGDQAYTEQHGFWVRGRSSLLVTFAPPLGPDRAPGVPLSLHGGPALTHVRLETSTWGTTIALQPGVTREIRIPALQGQPLLPVRITPDTGFVPALTDGSSDPRLLGCWIEVLE